MNRTVLSLKKSRYCQTSSGNEVCSSLTKEVGPCQAVPGILEGMNHTVLSLKKSRYCQTSSGNEVCSSLTKEVGPCQAVP